MNQQRKSYVKGLMVIVMVFALHGCGGGGGSPSSNITSYAISGNIAGLNGAGLILTNAIDTVAPAANATSFQFSKKLLPGTAYDVTISQQPANQQCTISNAKGVMAASDVALSISCVNVMVGQFRDAPVAGIQYQSADNLGSVIEGVTGQNGEFRYRSGDQVKFLVGTHTVGQATAGPLLTVASVTKSDQEAQNVARFLQSIDDDQNPDNGIRLLAGVHTEASKLKAIPLGAGVNEEQMQSVVSQLFPGTQRNLIPLTQSEAHRLLSERLSLLQGTDIYKAVVPGQKTYSSTYYNATGLDASALARLRLYVWEKWQLPQFRIVQNSTAEAIQNTEKQYENKIQRIEMLDAMADVGLLMIDGVALTNKFRAALANPTAETTELGRATIAFTGKTVSTIVTVGSDDCIQSRLECWSQSPAEQQTKDPKDPSGPEIAKTLFYGFGAMGDSALAVDAAKSIVAATTDDPAVKEAITVIGAGIGAFVDAQISQHNLNIVLRMTTGGKLSLAKDLTVASAKGAVALNALPALAGASKAINTYNLVQTYLQAWFNSAGQVAWRNASLEVPNANDTLTTLKTLAEREGLSDSSFSVSKRYDPDLAISLVAEHLARNNQLVGVYQRQLGKAPETFKLSIEGVPSSFNVDQTVTMRLTPSSTHRLIKAIRWDVSNGQTSVTATGEVAALALTKPGNYSIRADVEFEEGPAESVQQSVTVWGKVLADPASPTVGQRIMLWMSDLWSSIKQVVWSFSDSVSTYTASVVDGISEKISHTFGTGGDKTITTTFKDTSGNSLGSQSMTVAVWANPSARISGVSADSGSPTGAVPDQGTMSDNTPGLAGIVSAALGNLQSLRVYNGNTLLGTATVSGVTWTLQLPALAEGTYVFRPVVYHAGTMTEGAYENTWTVTLKTASAGGSGKLPHSGITASQCYSAGSNTLMTCSGVANTLNGQQDGHRASINAMSYSAVTNPAGGSYPITSCVKDNVTGLIWEGKEASGTRSGSNGYTNYDSTASAQKYNGTAYVNPTPADIAASTNSMGYVAAINAMALCGYTDWRLPTVDELQTIVDYSKPYPGPTINTTWFPNTPGSSSYWASSPHVASSGSSAWLVAFANGSVDVYGRHNSYYRVRLVRASQ